jgi:hypothetical protein
MNDLMTSSNNGNNGSTSQVELKNGGNGFPPNPPRHPTKKEPGSRKDHGTYRLVVWMLGGAGMLSISGSILLPVLGHDVPPTLAAIAAAALGSMGGLLAPTPAVPNTDN